MKIRISALTDIGLGRDNNEDALVYCADLSKQNWKEGGTDGYECLGELGALLVVADGMGGVNAGEIASSLAIETVKSHFSVVHIQEALATGEEGVKTLLKNTVTAADDAINQRMATDIETDGMGTTIVICWIQQGGIAYFAWCGDSRGYLYNPATGLYRTTKDHSLVQEMVDKGEISEEEAFNHPDSNIITRGLGGYQTYPSPDIVTFNLHANDIVMLCSDGLCGYCVDTDIQRVFSSEHVDTASCCGKMLHRALDAGGADNIAIVMASLVDDDKEGPVTVKRSWLQRLFGVHKS